MILFREIDPFHFGRVGRAFVTLHAYELMNYNLMTFVNIKGCAEFPGAYVRVCGGISRVLFILPHPHTHTHTQTPTRAHTHPHAHHSHAQPRLTYAGEAAHPDMACDIDEPGLGWVAVIYFLIAKVIGGFILVTLLVSFVISSYSEVYEARMDEAQDKAKIENYRRRAQEQGISWFVTPKRVQRMQKVFDLIDVDRLGTIDIQEASSFLKFLLSTYMDIKFPEDQDQSEDMLMAFFAMLDPDGSNDNPFSEFVGWLCIAKLAQIA